MGNGTGVGFVAIAIHPGPGSDSNRQRPEAMIIISHMSSPDRFSENSQPLQLQPNPFASELSRIQTQIMQSHMSESRQVPVTKVSTKTSIKLSSAVTKNSFNLANYSGSMKVLRFSVDAKAPCKVRVRQFVIEKKSPSWNTIGYREDLARYPEPCKVKFKPGMAQEFPARRMQIDMSRWSPSLLVFSDRMTIPLVVELVI